MSSGAPPGYNENISMLSGGNSVPILKVMGGGGMVAPPNYNSNESLLQGGNSVPIVKVMGGGGSDTAQIEIYEPVVPEEEKNAIQSFLIQLSKNIYSSKWKEEFIRNYNVFKNFHKEKFVVGQGSNARRARVPKLQNIEPGQVSVSKNIYQNAERYIQTIPSDKTIIIIIPFVDGDCEYLMRIFDVLILNELMIQQGQGGPLLIRDDVALVFMTNFFKSTSSDEHIQTNVSAFYLYLKTWVHNKNSMYILQQYSNKQLKAGADFYKVLPKGTADDFFPNFLNPYFVVVPKKLGIYTHVLLSAQVDGENSIVPENINSAVSSVVPFDNTIHPYFIIRSGGGVTELPSSQAGFPICKTLVSLFSNKTLEKQIYFPTHTENIHVFRFGEESVNPLICNDSEGLTSSLVGFSGTDEAKGDTTTIFLDGLEWRLRIPIQNVEKEWEKGIFTNDEAKFLNYLKLSPYILEKVFPPVSDSNEWKIRLSRFLANLVDSKCFDDVTYKIDSKCQESRNFLNKIMQYLNFKRYVHLFDDDKDEVQQPVLEPTKAADPESTIEWPAQFKEIGKESFTKTEFGSIEKQTNMTVNKSYIDLIVVHKPSNKVNYMRYFTETEKPEQLVLEIKKLEEDNSNFLFIY